MKIKFLKSHTVQDQDGTSYKAGEVYDLPDGTAKHFLRRRGLAVLDDGKASKKKGKPPTFKSIGIDDDTIEKLHAGGVLTIEEAEAHQDLTELDGIGPATATKVLKAIENQRAQ